MHLYQVSDTSILCMYKQAKLVLWSPVRKMVTPSNSRGFNTHEMWPKKALPQGMLQVMRHETSTYPICNSPITSWIFQWLKKVLPPWTSVCNCCHVVLFLYKLCISYITFNIMFFCVYHHHYTKLSICPPPSSHLHIFLSSLYPPHITLIFSIFHFYLCLCL